MKSRGEEQHGSGTGRQRVVEEGGEEQHGVSLWDPPMNSQYREKGKASTSNREQLSSYLLLAVARVVALNSLDLPQSAAKTPADWNQTRA
ncbi:unnamed protein product [Arctogadus glacialis]